jgi:serine phosphatase RsbU (regulator of sigma subunit)/integral membrane sensor domain MASE1
VEELRISDIPSDPGGNAVGREPPPLWRVLGLVAIAYAVGASLAFVGFGAPSVVALFLPAGVSLSALVINPRRRWPLILATVALTEVVVDISHGMSPRWVWGFALANTAEPLVGALLLRRYVPGEVNLLRPRDVVAFLGCCVGCGPVVGGLVGATTLAMSEGLHWPQSFVSFWAGDATGVLTIAGFVLAWHGARSRPPFSRVAMAVTVSAAATIIGFWPHDVPLFYLPIPALFWLAFSQRLTVTLTGGLATTVTANVMTSTGHGPWTAVDASDQLRMLTLQFFLVTTIVGAWALTVGVSERDRARSATSVERAARQRLDALQILTADLARAATSEAIAEAVVREGIGILADHGSAAIVAADGRTATIWSVPRRPGAAVMEQFERIELDVEIPHAVVIRTGRSIVHQRQADLVAAFPHLSEVFRALEVHSIVCVPVRAGRSAPLGSLAFSFGRDDAVSADVIAFAEALASLTGQALQRAQAYEHELDSAHQLQQALLPVLTDGLAGIRIGAIYRPADRTHQVGGDWYDVFALPGGRIGLAVGDVVGHHLPAAAAMARLQSALRIVAQTADGPAGVLDDLDRVSALIADSGMTTVGFADYDPATQLLRYACAGHPPPLLVTEGAAEYLWEGRSMPLGLGQGQRRHSECVVSDRATLVWYTDGLVERQGEHISTNMDRLVDAAVAARPGDPDDLCRHLMRHMVDDKTLGDDTVILCVQFTG